MKKLFAFINYSTPEENEFTDKGLIERKIPIETHDTFEDVKKKLLDAFGNPETLGKVYLQQQIEIRDLNSFQYKDKKFCTTSTFVHDMPIEVHFKKVPILFLIFTSSEKPKQRLLHVDPSRSIRDIEQWVKEEFQLRDNIDIELIHQSFLLPHSKCINDLSKFDPAHSIQIIPQIFKEKKIPPILQ